ncbi:methionyl-tRNA formyltransferase [Nocardia sp. NPDC060256]|uniref:methionyl-tRNA formyltransferase n=1 Tax=unclassified Nocardia TaxID=2637762 RepID=UPI0036502EE3
MRVVYAGHDFFSSCLDMLVQDPRVDVVLCLTSEPTGPVGNVTRIAHRHGIPVVFGRPTDRIIHQVNDIGADLLVVAAYLYRVPIERMSVPYAVNVHPSLLPAGRGPNPLPYLINDAPDTRGVTVHELTAEFDSGPILLQERISLEPDEGLDELYLKQFAAAPRLVSAFLADMDRARREQRAQGAGSYWPEHSDADRTVLAAKATAADVRQAHRMFGLIGIIVELTDGRTVHTTHVSAVACAHEYVPGTAVATLRTGIVVALADGLALVRDR